MAEIPAFLLHRSGLIVDNLIFANATVANLSLVLDGNSQCEESIPRNLSGYMNFHKLDFAVLHNITVNDKRTILRAIAKGYPILYSLTDARRAPETIQLYDALDKAGAVTIIRTYTTERIIDSLIRNFASHFIKRE